MEDKMKKYTIRKNRHYAKGWIWRLFNVHFGIKSVQYEVMFSESCYWRPPRDKDDYDSNKLCGLGFGFNHHRNSIRVVWKPDFENKNMIKLYGYIYDPFNDGHVSKYICDMSTNRKFKIEIVLNEKNYHLYIDDTTWINMENYTRDKNWGFYLYPYVGGNNTAIRNMNVYLDKTKVVKRKTKEKINCYINNLCTT